MPLVYCVFCSSGRFIFSKVDRLGRGKGRVKEKIILEFIDYSVKLCSINFSFWAVAIIFVAVFFLIQFPLFKIISKTSKNWIIAEIESNFSHPVFNNILLLEHLFKQTTFLFSFVFNSSYNMSSFWYLLCLLLIICWSLLSNWVMSLKKEVCHGNLSPNSNIQIFIHFYSVTFMFMYWWKGQCLPSSPSSAVGSHWFDFITINCVPTMAKY